MAHALLENISHKKIKIEEKNRHAKGTINAKGCSLVYPRKSCICMDFHDNVDEGK